MAAINFPDLPVNGETYPTPSANVQQWVYNSDRWELVTLPISADSLVTGETNKFFDEQLAQQAAAALFNNPDNTDVETTFDDQNNVVDLKFGGRPRPANGWYIAGPPSQIGKQSNLASWLNIGFAVKIPQLRAGTIIADAGIQVGDQVPIYQSQTEFYIADTGSDGLPNNIVHRIGRVATRTDYDPVAGRYSWEQIGSSYNVNPAQGGNPDGATPWTCPASGDYWLVHCVRSHNTNGNTETGNIRILSSNLYQSVAPFQWGDIDGVVPGTSGDAPERIAYRNSALPDPVVIGDPFFRYVNGSRVVEISQNCLRTEYKTGNY